MRRRRLTLQDGLTLQAARVLWRLQSFCLGLLLMSLFGILLALAGRR